MIERSEDERSAGSPTAVAEFEAAAEEAPTGLASEVVALLARNKKWWLLPIVLVLLLVGVLVSVGGGAAGPFIYTLF